MNYYRHFIILQLLFSISLSEITVGQKEKLLNGFINFYNGLPGQLYKCDEGSLENTQQVDDTTYQIVANLKVKELNSPGVSKLFKCTAKLKDSDDGVTVENNHCEEQEQQGPVNDSEQVSAPQTEVTEEPFERKPIRLENEVQSDTGLASGEQFIAIPRDQPNAPCVGCASHVSPQAAGVSDLANLGIRHLDIHEPSVKHSLDSVLDVERQVQVVNGVRYILTLSVIFNKCDEAESQDCASSKTCRVTILVKPWVKLPNGKNYRAILANNCTQEWQYGDDGEVLPEQTSNNHGADDDILVKNIQVLQTQPNQQKVLSDEDIRLIQEQIIPNSNFEEVTLANHDYKTTPSDVQGVSKQHVFKLEGNKQSGNSIPVTESVKSINQEKKKAIDEMLDFFDFSGFKPETEFSGINPRIKRSYENDLQVLSLAEDYHKIKKSIENAKFVYEMAQAMADYLNEMDIDVKTRVVQEVMKAEEETENFKRFVYVQARVTIPCDKIECEPKDGISQICNGVIDSTNELNPQILNTFCYNSNKEKDFRDKVKEVYLEDPVLQTLAKEAVRKIEFESKSPYAIKMKKIVAANTQTTSGALTKISLIIENLNCNKTVPFGLRINCTVLELLGSKICEVLIHERYWLQEKKISYTCTDRPVDMKMSKTKSIAKNITVHDPKIIEMLQESIQYLETQSNKNNKQKIVNITSISTQIVAGFLTKLEFIVGYTNCTNDNDVNCELLENENLRVCKAQIWDRSWIIDGKQIEILCNDMTNTGDFEKIRGKRSIDVLENQKEQNVNNITYKKLAEDSLKKYLQSTSSKKHYVVESVDKVKTVSAMLTLIDFTITPTNCLIEKNGNPALKKCEVVNSDDKMLCHSKILGQNMLYSKQYFVSCVTKYQFLDGNNNLIGLKDNDPSDSKYYRLANESLTKYFKDRGISRHHRIVRVEKVTTQIVSGLLTSIEFIISPNESNSSSDTIKCHSQVLEKHWLKSKDYDVTCEIKEKKDIDVVSDPENQKLTQIAVESLQEYIRRKPDSQLLRVTFVDKATLNPSGTNILEFLASHSEDDDGDTFCHAEYLEKSLVRNYITVKCDSIGTILKKSEITEEDPNYFQFIKLAEKSLKKYLQSNNKSDLYTIVSIENINMKWDKGIKTEIQFIVSPIDLENNELSGLLCTSQIREQPWLSKEYVNITCTEDKNLYRVKRQLGKEIRERELVGGLTEQNPNEPRYKALADESLHKYLKDNDISEFHKVDRVVKVTTQVVSGSLTRLDFVISNGQDLEAQECHSEVWEQLWLNKKEIKVSCALLGQREKRQKNDFGGETDQNPNEPQYKALADKSLQKYLKDNGISEFRKVDRVVKVTTQVVSGSLTRLDFVISNGQDLEAQECHSEVWQQRWLNKKEIKVSCALLGQREKRQKNVFGGETDQNPNEPQYKALADKSLQKYLKDNGISEFHKVDRVVKVTTQVVSGSLTRLDFVISNGQDLEAQECHSEVWEQLWLNKKEIKVSCALLGQREKHHKNVLGGETDQNPNEPQYKALADKSLQKYLKDNGISEFHKVDRVVKVTTQVVSGSLTRLDFVISNGQDLEAQECHSEVWEQLWLNKKEIKVSCALLGQREKRQKNVFGGETDQNPNEPQYKALADESLRKYLKDNGISEFHKVDRVVKVTTQVVSGSLTRLDFVISNGQDSKAQECNSEVWEQRWLNKKEIKVSCALLGQREKRQKNVFGGETDQNPNEPQYKALADKSLQKYLKDNGISEFHKVDRVVKVTTQVVSGSLTRLDFVISNGQDLEVQECHSEVWEQLWLNKKEIKVSCALLGQREKRQKNVFGGETDQNPNEPQYKALADESLQKYLKDNGISEFHKVDRVVKVTTQVVSGSLTRLEFVISNGQDLKVQECHSEVWEQRWLNKKEIKVSCALLGQREKRQKNVFGGETDQNPNEPQYKALADKSLQKYLKDNGISEFHKVDRVVKVTTQVVSGSLTRLDFVISNGQDLEAQECHSEVWEQLWLNKKEIKVSCALLGQREKRHKNVLGGETDQNPNEPQYKALADKSLQKYLKDNGISEFHKVDRVVKVTTQVVSGSLTRLDFVISNGQDLEAQECHSEVWEQLWLNKKEIKVSCALLGQREKRQKNVFGGETDQNPNEPQYKALADESLRKYLKDNGISEFHKVDRVVKVTTQVVSGSLTRLDFVISNGQDLEAQECHSEVWEQLWLNKKEIKVSCALLGQREKRHKNVLGGETDQNPNEPQYKALADESLRKYLKDNGISEFHKVDRVVKVTTQVVSGSLTRLDFVISNGQDSKAQECNSEVWEQRWLNKKEIKVSCALLGQREKRQKNVFGGETDQNPNEPQYKALADKSLQKYLKDNGISEFHKVDRVVKVTTQVVSGSLTRLDFVISNGQDLEAQECHSEVWEQLWLNKKEIKVSCALLGQREKRQKRGVVGGQSEKNPDDPQYKVLADESLQKYLKDNGISEFHKVDRVVKVTTQVVSGSLTRLDFVISNGKDLKAQECNSEVWEQLWLNKKEIKVSCALLSQREKRQKRGVVGGRSENNPDDPQYKALADESLQKYLKDNGISEFHKVDRVVKVTTQVVSGSLTRLDFVISNGKDLKAQECNSEVWEQLWLNKKEIKVSCALLSQREKRQKRGVVGGRSENNPDDPQYKALADESLQKYLKDNGISEFHKVDRVVKVTTQVVSGSLTRLDFVISTGKDLKAQECNSEVWEQLWLNKKEIKVSCALLSQREKRQKRGVVGGRSENNPDDPQYKALADESLQKYLKDNGISEFHKVDRVVKVTTQVVSGSLTRLDFVISNGKDLKAQECNSEVWEQLWLNKKEIKVSCALLSQREKRQKRGVVGGRSENNPDDPQYKALADESLQKYLKDNGISEFHKVDRVVKVTTQVVSGSLTRLDFVISNGKDLKAQECNSEVWEQLWLNKKEIKVSCALLGQREKRQKRGVVGGQSEKNPDDPQYKALADESLQKYLKDNGISEFHKVDRVVKVTTQVVSGSLTRLDFVISNGKDLKAQECNSEVWEQLWLNKKEIKVSCALLGQREKRQKRGVVGGQSEKNPDDPQYKALADESLQKYLKDNGISEFHKVDRVVKVTTQVVSGSLTRLDFVISNGKDLKAQECNSEVWEQLWLNKKEIKVSCALLGQREKRQKRGVVGGQSEKNPDDPQYKALADESLQKYLKDSGISEFHKVDRVVKVTTQVVSGSLTSLDFLISNRQDLKAQECHSEVWEKPWLSYKSFNISCWEKSRRSKRQARDSENNESSIKDEDKKRLRGGEEEQDAHKAEYKVLAIESLRKYQSKGSIYHKVLEVKRVVTRVVSGIKYKIDFTAAPTSCAVNISNLHVHKCKVVEGVTLYCHSEIWDRPGLKQKNIDVQCHGPDDNDFDEYETDVGALDDILKLSSDGKTKDDKYKLLAEEASEKYLNSSNRKYVHKVTHIHSVSEHIANGNIIKLEFSMSPTKCLRNETRSSNDTCAMKLPLIVIHCTAKIWDRPWLQVEKDIKTNCKKLSRSKKFKRELGARTVRQTGDEDDIDEETTYYYADRAVQHVNDQSSSNNLHKLVTIHAVQNSVQMKTPMIRMYIELAETYCLRHHRDVNLHDCEEMNGLDHRLCLARLWPSPDDELVIRHVSVICDDDEEFASVTALNIPELLKLSIEGIERSPENHFKLIHQGEPQVIPALDSKLPIKLNFIIATTNCSKHVDLAKNPFQCYIDSTIPAKACHSYIWMEAETRTISVIDAKCPRPVRSRRSPSGLANVTADNSEIQNLVTQSLEKLEMSSLHRYKQRVLQINSHSTKITTGKVTTIDFDVGYTSCLKYEWVENITSCDFLEHLPRRRCVAQIFERLWINNGKNIDVNCVDDETPLESHIEFESAEMANQLASEALKHIEAKYPHPKKQKVVRIFSLEKQVVAGIHYRMKVEVGFTDCVALSEQTDCKLENDLGLNKFCRVNVWIRPWTDHPPNFRVSCDYQEGATHELYHHVQAEHLFYNFLTTYSPSYVNDYSQMQKRFEIFKANVKKIHELNVYDKGTARYGVTRFTDLTYEEFSSRYMGLKTDLRDANQVPTKKAEIPDIKIPQNFDWREYDAVTDVKDQGSCGSCWAFSVTGNIEGQWKMQSGQLVSLSEQELVDCDKLDNGCNGGLPDNAYRAIEQLGGLEMEIDYPYEGEDDKCLFNKTLSKVQISGAVNITTNETGMAQWLVHNGPISIGINANAMQFYMGGISHPWKMLCNPTNLDHGVLIVGYGVKDYPLFHKRLPYWIVKNSWGKSWGEQGYYRVFRGDGTCGVNQMASSAVI